MVYSPEVIETCPEKNKLWKCPSAKSKAALNLDITILFMVKLKLINGSRKYFYSHLGVLSFKFFIEVHTNILLCMV